MLNKFVPFSIFVLEIRYIILLSDCMNLVFKLLMSHFSWFLPLVGFRNFQFLLYFYDQAVDSRKLITGLFAIPWLTESRSCNFLEFQFDE